MATTSSAPPVCHIAPTTTSTQPKPVALPSIPAAQPNLQSLTNTVNQMRQVIMLLTGRQGAQGSQGSPGANGQPAPKQKPARWTEQSRQTETVKVFNPDDKTQFIEVERINGLTMQDGVTGESGNWKRDQ